MKAERNERRGRGLAAALEASELRESEASPYLTRLLQEVQQEVAAPRPAPLRRPPTRSDTVSYAYD
jgi:hypothetical protein